MAQKATPDTRPLSQPLVLSPKVKTTEHISMAISLNIFTDGVIISSDISVYVIANEIINMKATHSIMPKVSVLISFAAMPVSDFS